MRRKPVDSGGTRGYVARMGTSQIPLPATVQYAPDYPIDTGRLLLRPFRRGDVDAVYSYRSRPDVAEYLTDSTMSHGECADAVRARAGQISFTGEGDKIVLAMERKDDARLIGEVSLIWRSVPDRQGEVGYILHPDAHRQGLATEGARALLAFGFEVMGLHRIYARCDARNAASAKVMKRLGMTEEARLREHMQLKGRWHEEVMCAVLDREWFGQD
jgi:RimJ/RimL family protein N-acetyltransferase